MFTPTPLRISTMTVTGHLGHQPDLQRLYSHGAFIPYWWIGEGILKIELGKDKKGIAMEDILHDSAREKKRFFNQSSLVFRVCLSGETYKEVNIKLFKNGGFQMTGISSEDMARHALNRFMEANKDREIWAAAPHIRTFDIRMMNSDYSIGKAIRRDRLHKLLVETYGLFSSFEPTIYQGVNTKFFWNKTRTPETPPGICVCPESCLGNGDGYSVGNCKKITISPFRTGSVIITGAKNTEQLMDSYHFLNKVFEDHADLILRDEPGPVAPKKVAATTTEGVLRQKIRASPRNLVAVGSI
jgi:TATA-box binding protein (TBP) (component of TFIID and TFIIIB)